MMTTSTPNYDDKLTNVSVVLSQEELRLLLLVLQFSTNKVPNATMRLALMNKLERVVNTVQEKTEVPTREEPTELILAFTNLTTALGLLTEAIQRLGELQAEKNRIESFRLRIQGEVPNPGQFVRQCHSCPGIIFRTVQEYEDHYKLVHHE